MALCSKSCKSGCGFWADSSGSEAGSSCACLQFGVQSYLHHFYEGFSAVSDTERETVRTWRWHLTRSTGHRNGSVTLGVMLVTSGLVSLSAGYSTPTRSESIGEGDLLFMNAQAISFNRGLYRCTAAGIGLVCLGSGLTLTGTLLWSYSRSRWKERPHQREWDNERKGGAEGGGKGDVVSKAPVVGEGKAPGTLSNMVQPS